METDDLIKQLREVLFETRVAFCYSAYYYPALPDMAKKSFYIAIDDLEKLLHTLEASQDKIR
jgi:hypothetical protein